MPQLYDLHTLLNVIKVQKVSQPAFWSTLFPQQINFETPDIIWDKVYEDSRKLAPFVIPTVQGRPQRVEGYQTVSFAPAYIKIKDVVTPDMHMMRMAGEALGTGSMTIEQRRNAVIAWLLQQAKTKVHNRYEWLASKAIIDGKVVIKGEDYPERLVDFMRDPSLTGTLVGAAAWSSATSDPLADLKRMRMNVNNKSGARITKHIFGAEAWDKFASRVDLKELMDKRYGGMDNEVTRMWDGYEGMEYMGRISGLNGAGRIDAWVNTSKFIDAETGDEDFYLDQNKVVGISEMVQGVRCFGAIMDAQAGYRPLSIFSKNWIQDDPSHEFLLTQSAPLMVPRMPDATYCLDVGQ